MKEVAMKEIQLAGSGIKVFIPVTFEYAKCKGCHVDDLIWATTTHGKSMPVHFTEKGWVCHFEDCANAISFRKEKHGY